jgi:type IV secretory pathway TrbD component
VTTVTTVTTAPNGLAPENPTAGTPATLMPATPMPVHASLVRPQRYLGVERVVLGLEATLCLAVLATGGVTVVSLFVVALIVFAVHPVLVWVTAKDLQAIEVYLRSRRYADFYAPHAAPWRDTPRPHPSVPPAR